jgi:pimeloyl-ACP methyl ester carboxylesterase
MMTEPLLQFLDAGAGLKQRRIAYLHAAPTTPQNRYPREGRDPDRRKPCGLIWLTGLKSDMVSTKAVALAEWAATRGLGMTRFDYSGHGRSDVTFEDAVVSDWIEEARAILERVTTGDQILVGSSTGGHVALALLKQLITDAPDTAARIRGLVLIAPAWDLTEELMWKKFPAEAKRAIVEHGRWVRPSDYDPNGYVITRRLIEDGRKTLIGGSPFDPGRPVHIIQGLLDTDVPPEHTRQLLDLLHGGWTKLIEVPDAGHRLSRPEDLALMFGAVMEMVKLGPLQTKPK